MIRQAEVADAAAIVRLGRAIESDQLATDESLRALLVRKPDPRTRRLVVEIEGQLVGWARSGVYESGTGWFFFTENAVVEGFVKQSSADD